MTYCIPFSQISIKDVPRVGGKNASLGEMVRELTPMGIRIPDGFAVTADAFRLFLSANDLEPKLSTLLDALNTTTLENLPEVGEGCRQILRNATLPREITDEVTAFYHRMGQDVSVAVRSSATAEDLPTASFAGQHESYLDVQGIDDVLAAIHRCYVSLYNDRAIKYRIDNHFNHLDVALSAGVQLMVRSDVGSAGVAFTLDPETGFRNVVYITSTWGQGEAIVQGAVTPDEWYLFKPAIGTSYRSVIRRRIGAKETSAPSQQHEHSITEQDAETLGVWCMAIERHYGCPMDVEFAKDGITGELFVVQARPETIHATATTLVDRVYALKTTAKPLCTGTAVGRAVATGRVRIITSLADVPRVEQGDVIVADTTNPDWNALLRKASCIVTNKGGRTSHASIVARELGIHAVVGTGTATSVLHDNQVVTVSCVGGDEGHVYDGALEWDVTEVSLEQGVETTVQPMFILADPDKAMQLAAYPSAGVGLMRMEFAITNTIRIHPMALVQYDTLPESNDKQAIAALTRGYADKTAYFVDKLSEAIAMVAAAFHPKDVIVRMSDFKTNEYASLIGGSMFEPHEENPMLGFRGASRYYHPSYREGFGLECEAIRVVRDVMGLTNVKVMIPFCRTVDEGQRVLDVMQSYGLQRGVNGLEVYVMAEIPSNVILAAQFAEIFDGFSIGSNDLTQLTLGIDRDSSIVSDLFDERNAAVTSMLSTVISKAKAANRKIGLCGQAPSDHPEFAQFLVQQGIDSISFTPDALLQGIRNIRAAEQK